MASILDLVRPSLKSRLEGIQGQALNQLGREARRTVNASAARSNANPTALARAGARAASDAQGQVAGQFAQQRLAAEEADRNREDQVLNALMGAGSGLLMNLIPGGQAAKGAASAVSGLAAGQPQTAGSPASLIGADQVFGTAPVGAATAPITSVPMTPLQVPANPYPEAVPTTPLGQMQERGGADRAAAVTSGLGAMPMAPGQSGTAGTIQSIRDARAGAMPPATQEEMNIAQLRALRERQGLQPVADPLAGLSGINAPGAMQAGGLSPQLQLDWRTLLPIVLGR